MRRPRWAGLLVGGYLTVYLVFVLFPILWLLLGSLKTRYEALLVPPRLIFRPTMLAFEKILSGGLLHVFGNSLTIGLANVALALLLGIPAAYGLSRMRGPARDNISFWILSIRMAPAFGLVIPIYALMRGLGLLDTLPAVIIAHLTINLPLAVWLLLSYFDELPEDMEEAAMIDGCSRLRTIWTIVIPLSMPAIAAAGHRMPLIRCPI